MGNIYYLTYKSSRSTWLKSPFLGSWGRGVQVEEDRTERTWEVSSNFVIHPPNCLQLHPHLFFFFMKFSWCWRFGDLACLISPAVWMSMVSPLLFSVLRPFMVSYQIVYAFILPRYSYDRLIFFFVSSSIKSSYPLSIILLWNCLWIFPQTQWGRNLFVIPLCPPPLRVRPHYVRLDSASWRIYYGGFYPVLPEFWQSFAERQVSRLSWMWQG